MGDFEFSRSGDWGAVSLNGRGVELKLDFDVKLIEVTGQANWNFGDSVSGKISTDLNLVTAGAGVGFSLPAGTLSDAGAFISYGRSETVDTPFGPITVAAKGTWAGEYQNIVADDGNSVSISRTYIAVDLGLSRSESSQAFQDDGDRLNIRAALGDSFVITEISRIDVSNDEGVITIDGTTYEDGWHVTSDLSYENGPVNASFEGGSLYFDGFSKLVISYTDPISGYEREYEFFGNRQSGFTLIPDLFTNPNLRFRAENMVGMDFQLLPC